MENVAFIIASPRSGTTVLGEILGRHPDIVQWYEPYFIWDKFFHKEGADVRTADQATEKVASYIRREFEIVRQASGARLIIDKSPEHSFKIPLIHAIFPKAKIIHLIRDGRDVTLSISREWDKRRGIVENRDFSELFKVAWGMLKRHPFWRNRLQVLWFEFQTTASLNPKSYLNKSKWRGQVGWGPRFPGWQEALKENTILQFNALQWVKCEEFIQRDITLLPEEHVLDVRYEELMTSPGPQTERILQFLEQDASFAAEISAELRTTSINRWKKHFTDEQVKEILVTARPMLEHLEYPI